MRPQTYANLREDLKIRDVMREVEADLPFDLMPFPAEMRGNNGNDDHGDATVRSLGKALYFLRAAQRQAAELLGHRGRPPVQDSQQPQLPGHLPPVRSVRAAHRSGDAARERRPPDWISAR